MPNYFVEEANLSVHRLLKAEIDECFAFMEEPVTFEENKRRAFRRKNEIYYRTPEEELQLAMTRFRRLETHAVAKELEKKGKTNFNTMMNKRSKYSITPRTIKHDCRNHSNSVELKSERAL